MSYTLAQDIVNSKELHLHIYCHTFIIFLMSHFPNPLPSDHADGVSERPPTADAGAEGRGRPEFRLHV